MLAAGPKRKIEPYDNPRITPIAANQKPSRRIRVNSRNSRIIQFPLAHSHLMKLKGELACIHMLFRYRVYMTKRTNMVLDEALVSRGLKATGLKTVAPWCSGPWRI